MRISLRALIALVLLLGVSTAAIAGPWRCHKVRPSGGGSRTVVTNNGGNGGAAGTDPNQNAAPADAESKAKAELEEELGGTVLTLLTKRFGQRLIDDLTNDLIDGDDRPSLLSSPCPATGVDPNWQREMQRMQGQINAINAHLGLASQPEVGGGAAGSGSEVDIAFRQLELTRRAQIKAELAREALELKEVGARNAFDEQVLAAREAIDRQRQALLKREQELQDLLNPQPKEGADDGAHPLDGGAAPGANAPPPRPMPPPMPQPDVAPDKKKKG